MSRKRGWTIPGYGTAYGVVYGLENKSSKNGGKPGLVAERETAVGRYVSLDRWELGVAMCQWAGSELLFQ